MSNKSASQTHTHEEPRFSEEDGRNLVHRWRTSGESISKFARVNGLSASKVRYWKARVETPRLETEADDDTFVTFQARSTSPIVEAATDVLEIRIGRLVLRIDDRPGLREELFLALTKVAL